MVKIVHGKIPPEIVRLYKLGFAIHWLRPQSKIPLKGGWSKGEREDLETITSAYRPGLNPGVRLGRASKIGDGYLAVIDVDVKGDDPKYTGEAIQALHTLYPQTKTGAFLLSGRGGGSCHYYARVKEPVSGDEVKARSLDVVKVPMPSVKPSKYELETLTPKEIEDGFRLRPAWEIQLLCEGRQAAIVGAIHPDTGNKYVWGKPLRTLDDIPFIDPETNLKGVNAGLDTRGKRGVGKTPRQVPTRQRLEIEDTDIESLNIKPEQIQAIVDGIGVSDRSADVFSLCMTMMKKGISDAQIRGIFTRKDFYLGQMAYDHAKTNNQQKAAFWLEKYCLTKAREKVFELNEAVFDIEKIPPDDKGQDAGKIDPRMFPASWHKRLPIGVKSASSWEKELTATKGKDGNVRIIKTEGKNLKLILSSLGTPLIKRDLFALKDLWQIDTPWGNTKGQERSGSSDDALRIKAWFSKVYDVEPSINLLEEIISTIALENSVHPLRDYLEGLTWDGVERLDKAFKVYLGASAPEPYLSSVTRKFFQACVQRAFEPGCKFDHMIVFEGPQGIGKSSFGRLLAGDDWFIDGLPNFTDKDAALYLQGSWLCEVSELAAMYRSANESTKAFITRSIDKFRPPYGRTRQDFPRTTVFIGTTNAEDYLTDKSGNRRFWPIPIKFCRFKELARDRDQLWAEAMFNYTFAKEALWLKDHAAKQAKLMQELRLVQDEGDYFAELFLDWIAKQASEGSDEAIRELRLKDLFNGGPFSSVQYTRANIQRVGEVLRRAGYIKIHTRRGKVWTIKKGENCAKNK